MSARDIEGLLARLRTLASRAADWWRTEDASLATEAADALLALKAENDGLRTVLTDIIPMVELGREAAQAGAMERSDTPKADAVKRARAILRGSGEAG